MAPLQPLLITLEDRTSIYCTSTDSSLSPGLVAVAGAIAGHPEIQTPLKTANGDRLSLIIFNDDPGIGGVASHTHTLISGLASHCQIMHFCPSTYPLIETEKKLGVEHWTYDLNPSESFERTLKDTDFVRSAQDAIACFSPDLLIFNDSCPLSHLALKSAAQQSGTPYLCIVHFVAEYLAERFSNYLPALKVAYEQATEVVAVSEYSLGLLRSHFGLDACRGQVIYNGVPSQFFNKSSNGNLRQQLNIPEDAFVYLTVGRLQAVKGYGVLLPVVRELIQRLQVPLYFVWIGSSEGGIANEIRHWLHEYCISDRVILVEHQQNIQDYYSMSDAFVLLSQAEGMPLAILEAMAMGLPVVTTDASGIKEIDTAGVTQFQAQKLFDDDLEEKNKLISHMLELVSIDNDIRGALGLLNKRLAFKQYHANRMVQDYAALLLSAIAPETKDDLKTFDEIYEIIKPYTMIPKSRLESLYDLAIAVCQLDIPGNFVECGTCRGGSAALLCYIVEQYSQRPRQVYLCDTFAGIPAPTHLDTHQGQTAIELGITEGTLKGTLNDVSEAINQLCDRLPTPEVMVVGNFADTLPELKQRLNAIALLHADADWYQSTWCILDNLYDLISDRGVIQFDDYGYWDGCRQAIQEFEQKLGIQFHLQPVYPDGAVSYVNKSSCPKPRTEDQSTFRLTTPVALFLYRRPDSTRLVFERIAKAKPPVLFLIADGAASALEQADCEQARAIAQLVDWECEVHCNFSDSHLGLYQRFTSGMNWLFSHTAEVIILEDDCLPEPSFFQFCQEMLVKYRNDAAIMHISGNNFQLGKLVTPDSYYFSMFPHCWGWATWRRAWQKFNLKPLSNYERIVEFACSVGKETWRHTAKLQLQQPQPDWDYAWTFVIWDWCGKCILPAVNLVTNIGCTTGTHQPVQLWLDTFANLPTQPIKFPLQHPQKIVINQEADDFTQRSLYELCPSVIQERKREAGQHVEEAQAISPEEIAQAISPEEIAQAISPEEIAQAISAVEVDIPPLGIIPSQAEIQNWCHFAAGVLSVIGETTDIYANKAGYQLADYICNSNMIPFYFLETDEGIREVMENRYRIIRRYLDALHPGLNEYIPSRKSNAPIKVGILAHSFDSPTETSAIAPFGELDRNQFEVTWISTSGRFPQEGWVRASPKDFFVDASYSYAADINQVVETLRAKELDILFIATNITAVVNAVAFLASYRIAPIQIVGHNSPITTGYETIDYYMTGKDLIQDESVFSEKILAPHELPQCFVFPPGDRQRKLSRAGLGCTSDQTIYVSGANCYKITEELLQAWIEILQQVPSAVLVLYPFNPNWTDNYPVDEFIAKLQAQCDLNSINANRIIIVQNPAPTRYDVQDLIGCCDIYLDSYPYAGVTSLIDAIEVGIPIVTWQGKTARSCTSAALIEDNWQACFSSDAKNYIGHAVSFGRENFKRHFNPKNIRSFLGDYVEALGRSLKEITEVSIENRTRNSKA
jgi:predicted O-linked N-acetylglucosamine transferase (SPINDLY family)